MKPTALNSLAKMEANIGSVVADAERLERIPGSILLSIADRAARDLKPLVVRYLLANYDACGIGETGKMRSAIASVLVSVVDTRSQGLKLIIRMPSGIGSYKNGSFYKAAAAQNFGAVILKRSVRQMVDLPTGSMRSSSGKIAPVGSKAKQTIKKKALGMDVSSRAVNTVEEGRTLRRGGNKGAQIVAGFHIGVVTKNGKTSIRLSGGATVIRPKNFFQLSQTQISDFKKTFSVLYGKYLSDALGKRRTAS